MTRPRLCVIGPMIGRNPGLVTTQGERLSDLLAADGYAVISVSHLASRYLRPADIARTILLRRSEFDVAILQVFGGPSFVVEDLASRLLAWLDRPTIMVLRGGAMPVFASDHPAWTQRVLNRATALVAPSAFLARAFRPFGYQIPIIPNVVDLDHYTFRRRSQLAPRMFWMRSFHDIYNPAMAVRVLARVARAYPSVSLVMAGSDLRGWPEVQRLAETLGVGSAVRCAGFLDPAAKRAEFDRADIYLNTNRIDNMPVSVVEACASGVPVVATRAGGVPDLLTHDDTALLVRNGDDEDMAGAVIRLLGDAGLAARLSANGRRLAEQSGVEAVLPEWRALIERVAGGSRDAAA